MLDFGGAFKTAEMGLLLSARASREACRRYYSTSHGGWIDTEIVAVDAQGQVEIHLKPGWSPCWERAGRRMDFWSCLNASTRGLLAFLGFFSLALPPLPRAASKV